MDRWIFYLITDLLLPVFIIFYSSVCRGKAPRDKNGSNGYKTTMSRLNRDTWEFANRYYNRLMRIAGWILLFLSVGVMLAVRGKSSDIVGSFGPALLIIQLLAVLFCMIPTERALRKTFDADGNRK